MQGLDGRPLARSYFFWQRLVLLEKDLHHPSHNTHAAFMQSHMASRTLMRAA